MDISKAYYTVTMPDNEEWAIPIKMIAAHKAQFIYDSCPGEQKVEEILETILKEFSGDHSSIAWWAKINMTWESVKSAIVVIKPASVNREYGWGNGSSGLIEELPKNCEQLYSPEPEEFNMKDHGMYVKQDPGSVGLPCANEEVLAYLDELKMTHKVITRPYVFEDGTSGEVIKKIVVEIDFNKVAIEPHRDSSHSLCERLYENFLYPEFADYLKKS